MPGTDDMHVTAPRWEYKWNLNTIAVLVGFAGGFVAWGATWQSMIARAEHNQRAIVRVEQQIEPIPTMSRQIENHAYRIDRAEERAAETNQTIRMVEHTLNQLSSDLRVTREILERMEANSRGAVAE